MAERLVWNCGITDPTGIYLLKVNIETLEQGVKYVQSYTPMASF